MKSLIALLLLGILSAHAQSYRSLVARADSLYSAKDFKNSLQVYEQAFQLEKNNRNDLYNAACSAARAGVKERAFDLLDLALQQGWIHVAHATGDSDLVSLHEDARWRGLLERMDQRREQIESNYDRGLQGELIQILQDDQKYRTAIDSTVARYGQSSPQLRELFEIINRTDSVNLLKVRAILDSRGWVGPETVGEEASLALFLVIQHADLPTQEHYLPMMKEAVSEGKASPANLALLVDRIEMRNGRPQIYGSQITIKDGQYVLYPIRDELHVNERRAEVGLGVLEDYVKQWNIIYRGPTK